MDYCLQRLLMPTLRKLVTIEQVCITGQFLCVGGGLTVKQ
jgi:hypothetical protein